MSALAEKAGRSNAYISHLESGRITDPSANALKQIAEALGTDVASLMDDSKSEGDAA